MKKTHHRHPTTASSAAAWREYRRLLTERPQAPIMRKPIAWVIGIGAITFWAALVVILVRKYS